jgi:predicted tellurium resistance membrane protein TerC
MRDDDRGGLLVPPDSTPSSGGNVDSNTPRKRKRITTYPRDDPGWLAPFNALVFKYPTAMFLLALMAGGVVVIGLESSAMSHRSFYDAFFVEVLMSVDNVCLFLRLFDWFGVPRETRPGILLAGTPILFAIRALIFFALDEVYYKIRPLMFVVGVGIACQGLLVLRHLRLARTTNDTRGDDEAVTTKDDEDEEDGGDGDGGEQIARACARVCGCESRMTTYDGSAFVTRTKRGVIALTPMLLCVGVVELFDGSFCVDSVSTVFELEHHHVLTLYLGNVVAACMMRALYPQLAGTVDVFPDLNYSVSAVLVMVGVDMCMGVFGRDIPSVTAACAMAGAFACGICSSVIRGKTCGDVRNIFMRGPCPRPGGGFGGDHNDRGGTRSGGYGSLVAGGA